MPGSEIRDASSPQWEAVPGKGGEWVVDSGRGRRERIAIPPQTRPKESAELVRRGVSSAYVDWLGQIMRASQKDVAAVVRIPDRTITRRRKSGRFQPEESERILRVSQVVDAALRLFEGDRERAMRWLSSPRPAFDGQSALAYCDTAPGARFVLDMITRIEHGVFS